MKRLRWLLLPIILIVAAWLLLPGIVERRFNHTLHAPPHQPSAQAEDLHRKLTVVDLHADSLLWGRNLLHRSSTGHVDVPRLAEGNVSIQAFTVVTTSPRKLNIYRNSDMVRYLAIF
jgi:membrane dipeptidase